MDPTREEMLAFLAEHTDHESWAEFDIECAIYWFAAGNHGGQGSNLYATLSASQYKPGPLECKPPRDSLASDLYDALCEYFG